MVSSIAYAAPGDLDTTFNPPNGVATYDGGSNDYGSAVALQADGRIVVAGLSDNGTDYDVLVLRYNTNGSLDTGFGTNGVATYDSGSGDDGSAVALQADGKIVVAGLSDNGTDGDVLVLRYNTNGSLDTGFGTNGVATYDSGGGDSGDAVALQADGRIVVAGLSDNGTDADVLVLRYDTNGSLDTGFGTNGVATYDSGSNDYGLAVALQADGKIVVAGLSDNGKDADVLVLRYNTNGLLDTTFDTDGVVTYDGGGWDHGFAVALQDDGKIVVAGLSDNGTDGDVLVLRYDTNGSLDTGFGTNGVVTYDSGSDEGGIGGAVALQADGRIVVASSASRSDNGTVIDVLVLRYTTKGLLDTGFGTGGVVTYDGGSIDVGSAVALQDDGKIVVAGWSDSGTDADVLVMRLLGGRWFHRNSRLWKLYG